MDVPLPTQDHESTQKSSTYCWNSEATQNTITIDVFYLRCTLYHHVHLKALSILPSDQDICRICRWYLAEKAWIIALVTATPLIGCPCTWWNSHWLGGGDVFGGVLDLRPPGRQARSNMQISTPIPSIYIPHTPLRTRLKYDVYFKRGQFV
jgi:hypothetical protein